MENNESLIAVSSGYAEPDIDLDDDPVITKYILS